MLFTDANEVIKECKKLGYTAVLARLNSEYFGGWNQVANEWVLQYGEVEEEKRHLQILHSAQWTAYASWALALVTLVLAGGTIWIGHMQLQDARETREQQSKDAKALLEVQISVELDKQFDSPEMRKARIRLSKQLLKNGEVTETRVQDFFDKIGMYERQGRIDQDTVYASFSYWIERYWPELETSIGEIRKLENDPGYYGEFEGLYKKILAVDAKDGLAAPSKKERKRFLSEEATLPL